MDGNLRIVYTITRGDESYEAYLFTYEMKYWEKKGFTLVRSRVQVH